MSDRISAVPLVVLLGVCLLFGVVVVGLFTWNASVSVQEADQERFANAKAEAVREAEAENGERSVIDLSVPPHAVPEGVSVPKTDSAGEAEALPAEAEAEPDSGTRAVWVRLDSDLKALNKLLQDGWQVKQLSALPGNPNASQLDLRESKALVILEKN